MREATASLERERELSARVCWRERSVMSEKGSYWPGSKKKRETVG